jgi:hypothetical protein
MRPWRAILRSILIWLLAVAAVVYVIHKANSHPELVRHLLHAVGTRITAANIPQILSATAWPVVLLMALILFRVSIRHIFSRLASLTFGGKGITVAIGAVPPTSDGKQVADEPSPRLLPATPSPLPTSSLTGSSSPPRTPAEEIVARSKERPGNVFWVAGDIMILFDIVVRGGNRDAIVRQFRQLDHHLRELRFEPTAIYERFRRLYTNAEASLASDWTSQQRSEMASELLSIRSQLAQIIESAQPDFTGSPRSSS